MYSFNIFLSETAVPLLLYTGYALIAMSSVLWYEVSAQRSAIKTSVLAGVNASFAVLTGFLLGCVVYFGAWVGSGFGLGDLAGFWILTITTFFALLYYKKFWVRRLGLVVPSAQALCVLSTVVAMGPYFVFMVFLTMLSGSDWSH